MAVQLVGAGEPEQGLEGTLLSGQGHAPGDVLPDQLPAALQGHLPGDVPLSLGLGLAFLSPVALLTGLLFGRFGAFFCRNCFFCIPDFPLLCNDKL